MGEHANAIGKKTEAATLGVIIPENWYEINRASRQHHVHMTQTG